MDRAALEDLLAPAMPFAIKRMFGGHGVFDGDAMIALEAGGTIYLKADAQTIPGFEAENLKPFGYHTKKGRHTLTSYWRMPDRLYDDMTELAAWARAAHHTALRAAAAPKRRTSKKKAR